MKPILVIQNCDIESPGTILSYLIERHIPHSLVYSHLGASFPPPGDLRAVIVLGCPESVTTYHEHAYLKSLFEFTAAAVRDNVPVLGICFGGQLLAKVLGAKVAANPVKEIGSYQVRLTAEGKKDRLFAGFDDIFRVLQWHGDTFKVPFGATLLVEGNDCKNQAFRKGNLVGLQFHLETPLDEVTTWCDQYSHELVEVAKTQKQVVTDYHSHAAISKMLTYRLLDNFFDMIAT